jgi:hypothetical protein
MNSSYTVPMAAATADGSHYASEADRAAPCRREAVTPDELVHARELLWQHFEGTEAGLEHMQQTRPVGWRRGDPTTWRQGVNADGEVGTYGEGAMTSTTHCEAMWYVRTRPGISVALPRRTATVRCSRPTTA